MSRVANKLSDRNRKSKQNLEFTCRVCQMQRTADYHKQFAICVQRNRFLSFLNSQTGILRAPLNAQSQNPQGDLSNAKHEYPAGAKQSQSLTKSRTCAV